MFWPLSLFIYVLDDLCGDDLGQKGGCLRQRCQLLQTIHIMMIAMVSEWLDVSPTDRLDCGQVKELGISSYNGTMNPMFIYSFHIGLAVGVAMACEM